jgi:glycosyltransferase involved in cell wall biosynthesis
MQESTKVTDTPSACGGVIHSQPNSKGFTYMKKKVVLIQGYNTPYRNELFNLISEYKDIDFTLLYVEKRGENRKWKDELHTKFNEVQVNCKIIQVSYEDSVSKISYIDLIIKILKLNPDVIISQLGKYTILMHYVLFWKKSHLIHWSEATSVVAKNVNWFNKRYLQWHLSMPDAYLFPGKQAEEYHRYCGLPLQDNIFYAPNSVDADYKITEYDLLDKYSRINPLKILFIGSFVERKGFHLINSLYSKLKEQNAAIELHVAGDGPIKPVTGIMNHGFINKEDSIKLYKKCHIFIMPSLNDCNPLSVIEAAKTGNCLLVSRGVGNYPELVDGNGYVFEINDENDLFEQCNKLLLKTNNELLEMAKKSIDLAASISHQNSAQAFYNAIKFVTRKNNEQGPLPENA